jgi:hypothetical protein
MLNRLVILVLLVLVRGAWSQVPGNGSQQRENTQEQQKPAGPSKPVVAIGSPAGANNQDHASEKPSKYQWGELLAPPNVPNWFLVVVGGVTGWFVYKTLRAIKKQADIMETQANDTRESGAEASRIALATAQAARKAADAAEISAKAAMGVAVPTLTLHKFSFIVSKESAATFYQNPKVRLELKNYGQSPALLRKYSIGYSWDEDSPREFTSYPFEDEVIDAGGTYEFGEQQFGVLDPPPQEVIEDLVKSKRHLVFSGWVTYGDVFGSPSKKLSLWRELVEYDPVARRMTVMDTSPAAMKRWVDPKED